MIKIKKCYFIVELILLISFIILRINTPNETLIKIINYLPIIINFIYIVNKRIDNNLKLSIFLPIIADYFFLFTNKKILGISIFILIQLGYYEYLNKKTNIIIYIIGLLNIFITIIFQVLVVETIIYIILSYINIYKVSNQSKYNKNKQYLKYGIIFLNVCDLLIFINHYNLSIELNIIIDIVERIFYNTSQVLIVMYSIYHSKKFAKSQKIGYNQVINEAGE